MNHHAAKISRFVLLPLRTNRFQSHEKYFEKAHNKVTTITVVTTTAT